MTVPKRHPAAWSRTTISDLLVESATATTIVVSIGGAEPSKSRTGIGDSRCTCTSDTKPLIS
ncbi:MAG: hypothetical protein EBY84_07990 [Acidimicrobiia bacterium]|nr:hypothetical protein [Acidimicrobiia bacterium]